MKRRESIIASLLAVACILLSMNCIGTTRGSGANTSDLGGLSRNLSALRRKWHRSRPKPGEIDKPYEVYLVLDVSKPAIWIERDGAVNKSEFLELPEGHAYTVEYIDPSERRQLHGQVRVKQRGNKSQRNDYPELVYVQAARGKHGFHFDISPAGGGIGWPAPAQSRFRFERSVGDSEVPSFLVPAGDR